MVDYDEAEGAFRRATTRVPRKACLAHAATVGTAVSVVAPGAPGGGALARGDHVRMGVDVGRARILRTAPQHRGNWRNAADAFGRQRRRHHRQLTDVSDLSRFQEAVGRWRRGDSRPGGRRRDAGGGDGDDSLERIVVGARA